MPSWTCTTSRHVSAVNSRRVRSAKYLAETVRESSLQNGLCRSRCLRCRCRLNREVRRRLEVGVVLNHRGGDCVQDGLGLRHE